MFAINQGMWYIYIYIYHIYSSVTFLAQGLDMMVEDNFYFAPYKQSPDNCQLACVAPAVLPTIDAESLTIVKAFLALPEPRCVVCGEHDWLRCIYCDKLLRCRFHACLRANRIRYENYYRQLPPPLLTTGDWMNSPDHFLHETNGCCFACEKALWPRFPPMVEWERIIQNGS